MKLDNEFLYDEIDFEYTAEVKNKMYKVISTDEYNGTKIKYTECKTYLCKIIVTHNDNKSAMNFTDNIIKSMNIKGESTMAITLDNNGIETTTLFYTKIGNFK